MAKNWAAVPCNVSASKRSVGVRGQGCCRRHYIQYAVATKLHGCWFNSKFNDTSSTSGLAHILPYCDIRIKSRM